MRRRRPCRAPRSGAAPARPARGAGPGSGRCPRWRWPARCAGCLSPSRPSPPGCSTWTVGSSRISRRNCSHVGGVDPGRAEPGVDLGGRQVGRDHLAEFFGVDREPGIVARRPARRPSACRGRCRTGIPRPGRSRPGSGVVEDQRAQFVAGPGLQSMPSSRAIPASRTSPQTSRQIASASAGVSAPSRGLRGATTRRVKMAALAACWLTGSNSSSA